MFAATNPENTPMAYRASTSTNPNPVISPTFIEANYEALEFLLRDQCKQMRNNDLRTELENFNEDYDEEREMEPRLEPTRATTPTLRVASPIVLRRGERTVGFEGAQSREESRVERNTEGGRPLEEWETFVEAREVATNGASSYRRDSFERSKKSSWDNNRGHKNKDIFSPYRGPNHGLLPSLSKSPKEILATEKAARSFKPPPKMFGSK
ncbi:hypothetical protein Tco_0112219 [Tanacetum coccineum]